MEDPKVEEAKRKIEQAQQQLQKEKATQKPSIPSKGISLSFCLSWRC